MIDEKYKNIINQILIENQSLKNEGFNFFETISDTFYRENFHSDILQALLNIEEFYKVFITKMLDKESTPSFSNFKEIEIERETGRIDVSNETK